MQLHNSATQVVCYKNYCLQYLCDTFSLKKKVLRVFHTKAAAVSALPAGRPSAVRLAPVLGGARGRDALVRDDGVQGRALPPDAAPRRDEVGVAPLVREGVGRASRGRPPAEGGRPPLPLLLGRQPLALFLDLQRRETWEAVSGGPRSRGARPACPAPRPDAGMCVRVRTAAGGRENYTWFLLCCCKLTPAGGPGRVTEGSFLRKPI